MATITERIERVRQIAGEYRSATPPAPRSVKIELTAQCDFQCFFCAAHKRPRARSEMSRPFYRRIVRELREIGVEQLGVFYIGESFTCDWLPEAIHYARRECGYPYVFLTTNGLLAEAGRVRECIEAGLDSLKFSLNFSDAAQFSAATGRPGQDAWKVLENLKDARRVRDETERATGHRCGLYASTLAYHSGQESRMQRVLEDILPYVDEHYYLPLFGHAGLPAGMGNAVPLSKPLPCWPLFTEGHIACDGHLSACCLDHSERFNMGDLNRMSFLEAWHGPAFRAQREAHLTADVSGTACEKCVAYD